MNARKRDLPLVYSCSGCSSAAQMTNELATRLNREDVAEMSCIAGVGGGVKSLRRKAQSGRKILAIDGCKLQCVKACLSNADVEPDEHIVLGDLGVKKRYNQAFDPDEAERVYEEAKTAAERLQAASTSGD